tara:strand:+ start:2626 stop:3111 length:486 start_codon:yes stop_codon:yes gene_type:complete
MAENKTIIGLDLGTKTGWAILKPDGSRIDSGHWNLKLSRFESGGMRYIRLKAHLKYLIDNGCDNAIVAFEAVHRHRGVAAAHVYGGFMATMQAQLDELGIDYVGIGVGTIKKHATGAGNASKDMMIIAAQERWGEDGWTTKSNDEADALWVASTFISTLLN